MKERLIKTICYTYLDVSHGYCDEKFSILPTEDMFFKQKLVICACAVSPIENSLKRES